MRLEFFLDKTAPRPLLSIEIADPVTVRRRLVKASVAAMLLWLLIMQINFFTDGHVPLLLIGLPFVFGSVALYLVVIKIDETARAEEARSHEQIIG